MRPWTPEDSVLLWFPNIRVKLVLCLAGSSASAGNTSMKHAADREAENVLSASDRMMLGLFPPSSRVTFFRLLVPDACWMR